MSAGPRAAAHVPYLARGVVMARPVLQIVTASTRTGRKGPALARWVQRVAEEHGAFAVESIDLAEAGLPLLDEPNHPRLQQYTLPHTKDRSATIARADAFVFVTPRTTTPSPRR